MSVNGLNRDRVSGRVRVSIRVRVRACRPDSSGNLLTRHKMEFARLGLVLVLRYIRWFTVNFTYRASRHCYGDFCCTPPNGNCRLRLGIGLWIWLEFDQRK